MLFPVIRQFSVSQVLIFDMIFEWLEFLVKVQTKKSRKYHKNRQKTKKYRKKTKATANFKFGAGFLFRFFGLQPPGLVFSSSVDDVLDRFLLILIFESVCLRYLAIFAKHADLLNYESFFETPMKLHSFTSGIR